MSHLYQLTYLQHTLYVTLLHRCRGAETKEQVFSIRQREREEQSSESVKYRSTTDLPKTQTKTGTRPQRGKKKKKRMGGIV